MEGKRERRDPKIQTIYIKYNIQEFSDRFGVAYKCIMHNNHINILYNII